MKVKSLVKVLKTSKDNVIYFVEGGKVICLGMEKINEDIQNRQVLCVNCVKNMISITIKSRG